MGQIMLISFFILMFLGLPLYLSLLSTALIGIASLGDWSLIRVLAQQFYGGMDVFSLMAIPFFILTGILMNRAGLTDRLMDFSRLLVGAVRGGLGYVNVVAGIILAGVNGSAAADASAPIRRAPVRPRPPRSSRSARCAPGPRSRWRACTPSG